MTPQRPPQNRENSFGEHQYRHRFGECRSLRVSYHNGSYQEANMCGFEPSGKHLWWRGVLPAVCIAFGNPLLSGATAQQVQLQKPVGGEATDIADSDPQRGGCQGGAAAIGHAAVDVRRAPCRRRIFQPGRIAAGLSERAGARQSVFSNLRDGSRNGRHRARVAGARQDDVRVDSSGRRQGALRLDPRR